MRKVCPVKWANRTKMFHVKHFGASDTSRKQTFAKRWKIRARDLAQARYCDRIYDGELCPKASPSSRGGLQGRLEGCAARTPFRDASPVARFQCVRFADSYARNGTSGFLSLVLRDGLFEPSSA